MRPADSRARAVFLAAGIAMTLALLWASVVPAAGKAFGYDGLHYAAHFAAYAVFAFVWVRGLPRAPAWAVLAAVVAFGFAQEGIEIAGHAHTFEFADALVDAVGATAGILLERAMRKINPGGG